MLAVPGALIANGLIHRQHVCEVVELPTLHLAPKQILIRFRDEPATDNIVQTSHKEE